MRKKERLRMPVITCSNIEINGRKEILICGCKGLDRYSGTDVVISVPEGLVKINGKNLTMRWAGAGKLFICGEIRDIALD